MAGSQGWGSAGIFHEPRGQLRRFMGIFGGYVDQVSNYSFGTALVFLPHVVGNAQALHRAAHVVVLDRAPRQADGAVRRRQSEEHAGDERRHGRARHRPLARRDCARAGVEVVNVSPIRDDGPAAVAPEWISIRPGTDTAMLLALTHTLIAEGLHDAEFLARYCTGFERVQPYVMGDARRPAERRRLGGAITGVPAETIRALARRMAANRTMISASWSLQRADHGEQPYWAVLLLASCLGQIGLPGGGFGFGYGSASGIADPPPAFRAPGMEAAPNPLNRAIPAARITQCLLHPGERYDFNGKQQHLSRHPPRLLGRRQSVPPSPGHQPAARAPAAGRRRSSCTSRGGRRPRAMPTSCCRRRRRSSETTSAAAQRDPFVIAMQQAIEPVGEARNDFAIFAALAQRLGCEDAFTQGRDEMAWLRHLYDSWREGVRTNQASIPDFDRVLGATAISRSRRAPKNT